MFDDSDSPSGFNAPCGSEGEPELGPAQKRFRMCRWYAIDSDQLYCSHQDVLPYAGRGGFTPEAWCLDCTLYKLRRKQKKRPRHEDENYLY